MTTINKINVMAFRFIAVDGYGRYAMSTIKSLARLGVDIYPELVDTLEMPGWMLRMRGLDFSRLTLSIMPPHETKFIPSRQWNYTMYESTGIPPGWSDHVNGKSERLLVPCEWCEETFRDAGVKTPIHVVHGGVDPEEFPVIERKLGQRPYTFMAFGDRGARKGYDIAWQAFYMAFGASNKDVRLVIKSRPCNLQNVDLSHSDTRVSLWRDDLNSLADCFALADCFVFPTRGEGWGLPPREAACTGLPVICTDGTGTKVGIDSWAIPIRSYKWVDADILGGGQWMFPCVEEVAQHMRWCYENQEMAKKKGLYAAQWLRDHQTWKHSAEGLLNLMERYG